MLCCTSSQNVKAAWTKIHLYQTPLNEKLCIQLAVTLFHVDVIVPSWYSLLCLDCSIYCIVRHCGPAATDDKQ